jgi:uncharacterized protein YbjT (DUF2867 family)
MAALILLTGASGYIGSRLLRVLEEGGCEVRCLSRQPERVSAGRATTEIVAGDCLDESSLDAAMKHHIEAALERTRGRIEGPYGAAKVLGINPHTLRARMRKMQIEWQRFREV